MSEFDFEKSIHIDEDSLDLEWLDQPKLFIKIAQQSADAQFAADQAKAKYDVICSEMEMKIRNNPAAFKIEKITEGAVIAALRLTDEHKNALLKLNEAKRDASILQGAVKAFEQRKVALENLVRLHGQSYFAGPKIPRNLSDERQAKEAKTQAVNEKIKGRIQRKEKAECPYGHTIGKDHLKTEDCDTCEEDYKGIKGHINIFTICKNKGKEE